MKLHIISGLVFFAFQSTLISQFDLGWKTPLDELTLDNIEMSTSNIDDVLLVGDILVIAAKDQTPVMSSDKYNLYGYDVSNGQLAWKKDTDSFENQWTSMTLHYATDELFYFNINRSRQNERSIYGVMNTQGETLWSYTLASISTIESVVVNTSLYMRESNETNNKLSKIELDGTTSWVMDTSPSDDWNKLIPNGKDKLYWYNNNVLTEFDTLGVLVAKDTMVRYGQYYSHFHADETALYVMDWGSLQYNLKRYDDSFPISTTVELDYSFQFFGIAHPTSATDSENAIYVSSDYDYNGLCFISKLDAQLDHSWSIDSIYNVIDMVVEKDKLIVTTRNSIYEIDSNNGEAIRITPYVNAEVIPYRNTQLSTYNSDKNEFYTFTINSSKLYLSQYKLRSSVSTSDLTDTQFELFPNPVNNILNISVPFNIESPVYIYNALGQIVESFGSIPKEINVSAYVTGIYTVVVNTESRTITRPFIKE